MIQAVQDFVFDLHDSTRRALNVSEAAVLYDQRFRSVPPPSVSRLS